MDVTDEFIQSEIGSIPKNWRIEPLGNFLAYISYGFTNPMPTAMSGVYMITARDINQGKIQYDSARFTTASAYDELLTEKSRPRAGDLLLTKDGTLGRLALVGNEKICINQSVALLRTKSTVVPAFLKTLLEAPTYQRRMIEDAGGSTIKHIYITIVDKMPVAVPATISEQEAIAGALSDADAWIESLEQLIAKKRQIKQGAMQELLTGKRRLPGFSGEWKVRSLSELLKSFRLGGNYPNVDLETPFPLMKMGNVGRGTFNTHKVEYIPGSLIPSSQDRLRRGDVLFNTRNTLDLVGKVAIWREELPCAYFNSNLLRLDFDVMRIGSPFFMAFLLNSDSVLRKLRELATGTTSVAAIYTRDLLKFPIQVPTNPNEQTAIATAIEDIELEISTLETKLAKAFHIKQAMMQELLTGRIRLVESGK